MTTSATFWAVRLAVAPTASRGLFGVLHNFGGFGLCSGGSCGVRSSGGGHLGHRRWPRLCFPSCGYLKSGQRIVPQTALVEIGGIRPPRLVRSHLRGG